MPAIVHESMLLPGAWRLAWFGKLAMNPAANRPDLRIRAYLGRLEDETNYFENFSGRIDGSLVPALIPIGELPRLYLNAVLVDGCLASKQVRRLDFEYVDVRSMDCSRDNITVFRRHARDQQGDYIIPVRDNWRHEDPDREGLFVAFGDDKDPYAVIIPCFEIYRFFYATSDVLAKACLTDAFLDPHQKLWDTDYTVLDPSTGKAAIWLRKWMLDADARFLARFAFDPYALQQAQHIYLASAAAGPNVIHSERLLRALPPLQGRTQMRIYHINLDNKDRILVTRILSCDWKPPFTELEWDRDNDGRFDPNNREQREESPWMPKMSPLRTPEETTPGYLADRPPSNDASPFKLSEQEISERFPALVEVPARKCEQKDTTTRSSGDRKKRFLTDVFRGSVIDGQSSRTMINRTTIEALQQSPKRPSEQTTEVDVTTGEEEYLRTLALLKRIDAENHARVDYHTVTESHAVADGVSFCVFPSEIDAKRKAWLFVDEERTLRRMALVASVSTGTRTRYLIELQHKVKGECSTLILWTDDEGSICDGILAHLLMDCAYKGAATLVHAGQFGVTWGRLRHTHPNDPTDAPRHYLARILAAAPYRRSRGKVEIATPVVQAD